MILSDPKGGMAGVQRRPPAGAKNRRFWTIRNRAANAAAHRRKPTSFSLAKAAALSDYEVTDTPTMVEIDEFEQEISLAEDERPI